MTLLDASLFADDDLTLLLELVKDIKSSWVEWALFVSPGIPGALNASMIRDIEVDSWREAVESLLLLHSVVKLYRNSGKKITW